MCKRNFRWDLKSNLCPPLAQCVLPSLPPSVLAGRWTEGGGGGSAAAAAAPMSGGRTIKFMVWALGPPRSVGPSLIHRQTCTSHAS